MPGVAATGCCAAGSTVPLAWLSHDGRPCSGRAAPCLPTNCRISAAFVHSTAGGEPRRPEPSWSLQPRAGDPSRASLPACGGGNGTFGPVAPACGRARSGWGPGLPQSPPQRPDLTAPAPPGLMSGPAGSFRNTAEPEPFLLRRATFGQPRGGAGDRLQRRCPCPGLARRLIRANHYRWSGARAGRCR